MYKDNALLKGGATARFKIYPLVALLIFLSMFILADFLSNPLISLFNQLSRDGQGLLATTGASTLINLITPFTAIILVVFFWVKFIERRKLSSLGFLGSHICLEYFKGFGLGIGLIGTYIVFSFLLGTLNFSRVTFNIGLNGICLSSLIVLPGWLIQGASEEIITRGWLFQATSRKHVLTGLVLSSSIFALLHLGNSGMNFLAFFNLILYGLFASIYALYKENLWSICAFHSAWNWAQGNVFGIAVSGNATIGGTLVSAGQLKGPDYLTGGAFGAEGSVIVTVILAASTAYCLYLSYEKSNKKKVA